MIVTDPWVASRIACVQVREFRILGPLEVVDDDQPLALGGPRQRAALAILLLNANRVVPVERLIDDLYGSVPPATAVTQVQRHVSELRKVLGTGAIETRTPGYILHVASGSLDLDRFEGWTHDAQRALERGEPKVAAELLRRSLELWRGTPLTDLTYELFAQASIARLEELYLTAVEKRFEVELQLAEHAQLLAELEAIVQEHPLRERLRGQLMIALYRAGRQADALETYQSFRRTLNEELGIQPTPELRRLHASILRHEPELVLSHVRRRDLPTQPTSFIGREQELAELLALAGDDVRLVTVTGPGGSGKTRLALRAAAELVGEEEELVWIPLASLTDASLVLPTITHAVGSTDKLEKEIAQRRFLLLLDNFEQVVGAAPELGRLLAACPNLRLVVTSRERLGLAGEHEYPLEPMTRSDAIALFRERARAFQPHFQAEAAAISKLCDRLDDLPLAIELAAARVKALSLEQLHVRLEAGFDLLRGGRDADPAHRTLRATIGWSLNLLDDEERRLFAELAVFAGGWTLEAAEIVCHADIETLAALVDKSLIRRIDDRYSMLTTIRTYMRERLDETGLADGVMRALCQYLLALVREGTGSLRETAPTAELTQRLRLELDNVRAATEWALGAAEVELATVLAIESVWFGAGFGPEKRRFLHEAVNGQSLVRPNIRARALYFSGICAWDAREVAEAEGRFEEGLHLFRQLDDDKWIGRTMLMKGVTAAWRREYGQAKSCFDESLRLARETRDDQGIYQALHSLGELARKLGDIEEAEALLSQSEDAAVQAGGSWGIAFILHSRGDIALARLDLVSATRYYADALRLEADASQRPTRGILYCLGGLAAVAAMAGQLERAGRLWGAVLALQHHSDAELLSEDRRMYEENLSRSFAASDAWNDSVRTGRAMSLEQAIGYAFGPTGHRS